VGATGIRKKRKAERQPEEKEAKKQLEAKGTNTGQSMFSLVLDKASLLNAYVLNLVPDYSSPAADTPQE
jgi:hypothetical protein